MSIRAVRTLKSAVSGEQQSIGLWMAYILWAIRKCVSGGLPKFPRTVRLYITRKGMWRIRLRRQWQWYALAYPTQKCGFTISIMLKDIDPKDVRFSTKNADSCGANLRPSFTNPGWCHHEAKTWVLNGWYNQDQPGGPNHFGSNRGWWVVVALVVYPSSSALDPGPGCTWPCSAPAGSARPWQA